MADQITDTGIRAALKVSKVDDGDGFVAIFDDAYAGQGVTEVEALKSLRDVVTTVIDVYIQHYQQLKK